MRPHRFAALLLGLALGACDEPEEQAPRQAEPSSSGPSASAHGGGGDVLVGGGADPKALQGRYRQALDWMKRKDWDAAQSALADVLSRSRGTPLEEDARKSLREAEWELRQLPTQTVSQAFLEPERWINKHVSLRGVFESGGEIGRSAYYFWLESDGRVQCRYRKLGLKDKRKILSVQDGSSVFVRGTLQSPWGSNPDPYVEVGYFRLEKNPE